MLKPNLLLDIHLQMANHGSLWPKLLPFGCFFQRIGKANCAAQSRRSNVVAMWSSESDGDANPSQLVDEQTVRFQGQTGEIKIVHICRFQTLRCFVHCLNSAECLPGTDDDNEAAPRDGTLSSKPRTYVQTFL